MTPQPARGSNLRIMKKLTLSCAIVLALAATVVSVRAQSGYDLFQKALAAERADGNLKQAIELYERVVEQSASDRTLVARALVRIAACYEKLGQRDAARVYERIVRDFSDQSESVTVARARLNAMQSPALPATQTVKRLWSGPEVDPLGTATRDGRYLSYTDWGTGDLALRDLAEGTSRRLTNTGGWETSGDYAEFSSISPDGRQIAYAWFVDKGSDPKSSCACRYELRVMSITGPDAGKPRVLLRSTVNRFWVRPAEWMPDGKSLIIERSNDAQRELGVLSLADNSVRVLKSFRRLNGPGDRISVSPDGATIAFGRASPDNPAHDIFFISASDGRETAAVQNPADDSSPVFTADGTHLLFLSDRTGSDALWRLPLANGQPAGAPVLVASIADGAELLGVTRQGAAYYWTSGASNNVFTADLDEKMTARSAPSIAIERFLNSNNAPAFSPDGQLLAYHTRRGSTGPETNKLMIHTLATKQDRQIPLPFSPAGSVSWFPDSRSVLISVRDAANQRFTYHRVDLATGEHRQLAVSKAASTGTGRALVSADGASIFFIDSLNGATDAERRSQIVRFDIASGKETVVRAVGPSVSFTSFALSPDSTDIAALRNEADSRWSILEVFAVAGGPPRELFREKNPSSTRFSGLAWSPDTRYVLMVRGTDQFLARMKAALWKVPVAGGPAEPTGISMPGIIRFPTLDPTGRRIAFAAEAGGAEPAVWAVENFLPAGRK
jgi:Tol biopolymer transport system component